MPGLIASRPALDILLALTQRRDGARLTELAAGAGVALTTAQSALRLLLREGLVSRDRGRRPVYRLRTSHAALDTFLDLAGQHAGPAHALDVMLRANPAVEFAARDEQGYLVVRSASAEAVHLVALKAGLDRIQAGRERQLSVASYDHDLLRDLLGEDASPRERATRARLIKGSLPRSFPAPRPARTPVGTPLGRPHRSLHRVSRRALSALAREHGLRRIALFGSAVRTDFRADSDIDVLIEPLTDARFSLLDLAAVKQRLEGLFDRDVDVLTPGALPERMRERIEREAVALHG